MDDAIFWIGAPPDSSRLAWTWAGEWTVTYETFRDMGAAFGVALVLIYILVVWEFGNFRIPLVIMAPIPLTLLGIIPAHAIIFNLGLGGEFTATSMIGWIALAGIIVRNSILLVDFAVHEIQKGVPVAEAMIRSCKIRTRPIVITALALVAGSSVIITDPIFQGMAISLLSGVLVSTALTLIVIPLGCVSAGKDMCQVALATAPAGTSLPCLTDGGTKPVSGTGQGGGVSRFFGKIVEFSILALYAIRGIFLLLFDAAKSALKGKPKRSAPARVTTPAAPKSPASAAAEEILAVDNAPAPKVAKKRPAAKKAAPQQAPDAVKSPQTVQKKAPRRGIRLKIDEEGEPDER